MYNHYQNAFDYVTVEAEPSPPTHPPKDKTPHKASPLLGEVTGGIQQFLSGIAGSFSLSSFDSGDILLILIILLLLLEGDNLELIITLGLMLLLGLGDSGEDPFRPAK